ncbi:hypothetical protein [Pseudomonas lactis]|uniref:hypothetical protein n=1 Tax=Pseudomonas lactis TaxID=1615674 RepID=UPI00190E0309|nr:hypothetical protein [Pseudomonas lactis]MBK3446017.1 hypothetical protein [Pseudomonas lactis]
MTRTLVQHLHDHEVFILCEVYPLIMGYARRSETPNEMVIVTTFLHLAAMLKNFGLSYETLLEAVDALPLTMYQAPWGCH